MEDSENDLPMANSESRKMVVYVCVCVCVCVCVKAECSEYLHSSYNMCIKHFTLANRSSRQLVETSRHSGVVDSRNSAHFRCTVYNKVLIKLGN